MKNRLDKKIYWFYVILFLVVCISMVFTNISYDAEYQISMAYRLLKGDRMITQMWEPHQTSAFLCAILMKLYIEITGTTTGIVLFTQVMGLLIRGGLAIWFAKIVNEWAGKIPAFMTGIVYFLISPKELLTPEFGNMQIWFATIMFLCLLKYLKSGKKLYYIISAISLCLAVFSYPSAILCYLAVIVILFKYSKTWKKDIIIYTIVCALIGGSFVLYLLINIGLPDLLQSLEWALSVEPTHTVSMGKKFGAHLLNIGKILGMLSVVFLLGFMIERIIAVAKKKKDGISKNTWFLSSWYLLMFFFILNILSVKNRGGYSFPIVVILILGLWKKKLLSEEEKIVYNSAMLVSVMNLLATLTLSDNAFMQAITYMMVWICASFIPIYRWFQTIEQEKIKKVFSFGIHIWILLIIFRIIFIHIPIFGRNQICSLFDDLALIRSGPAIGIITDEEGAARQRDSMLEWSQFVRKGDIIWILGEPVDTLGYLYEDVEVGAPTVMSTPTYNENLLNYWEVNPDKYPDVVILASSFGELSWELSQNEWLMEWLEEDFCADTITDGHYWRYYERRR